MMRLAMLLIPATLLVACQSGRPPVPPPSTSTVEIVPDDAFASFGGKVVSLGEEVTIRREPIGVSELRALVAVGKTEWIIHTLPGGKEDKTATASIVVQRGDAAKNVRIQSGESGSALGVTIHVIEAGEVYEEASMRWVQFARVTFSIAQ